MGNIETYFSQIKKSDKSSFESFFKQYYTLLCNFAYSFLKEKEASEEVVQELFYKIWENRASLEIKVSEKAYLFTSVRNLCLNQIKHIEVKENFKIYNQQKITYEEGQEQDFMVEMELSQKISSSIESLPEQRQIIFRLSREEGLKYKEIAEKLNISIKTVETQMSKSLKFLRENLSDYLVLIIYFNFFKME